jgi:hypothetical protein
MHPEPSIFNEFEIPPQTPKSKDLISQEEITNQKPVRDYKENRPSKRLNTGNSHVKDSSIKSSQQSIKSEVKDTKFKDSSNTYGLSSNVQ